jgi:hypothetical protein
MSGKCLSMMSHAPTIGPIVIGSIITVKGILMGETVVALQATATALLCLRIITERRGAANPINALIAIRALIPGVITILGALLMGAVADGLNLRGVILIIEKKHSLQRARLLMSPVFQHS